MTRIQIALMVLMLALIGISSQSKQHECNTSDDAVACLIRKTVP